MMIDLPETDHPAVEDIMKEFEKIWPKIIWFNDNLKGYRDLFQSVYAHGMLVTIDQLTEVSEQTIH